MVQSAPKLLTVDEFITYYGDSDSEALLLSADPNELIDDEVEIVNYDLIEKARHDQSGQNQPK